MAANRLAARIVEAAAAVILRPDGSFLLGRRPEGKPYAGYWEFPGGKIEPGESAAQALVRELHEELGIVADRFAPWITREFVYPHAHVRLHFFRVRRWRGGIRQIHHDALAWKKADQVDVEPMLPANVAVLRGLALPDFYAITHAGEIGAEAQLEQLERALAGGLRLLQVREPQFTGSPHEAFARAATQLARRHGAKVLLNGDITLAERLGADGVHLPSARLMQLARRPDLPLVAASCHNAGELARAAAMEVDFVVVGPVRETRSHPGAGGLGWNRCAHLLEGLPMPAFLLGGLTRKDAPHAWRAGAHGIAAIRGAWQ